MASPHCVRTCYKNMGLSGSNDRMGTLLTAHLPCISNERNTDAHSSLGPEWYPYRIAEQEIKHKREFYTQLNCSSVKALEQVFSMREPRTSYPASPLIVSTRTRIHKGQMASILDTKGSSVSIKVTQLSVQPRNSYRQYSYSALVTGSVSSNSANCR